MVCGWVNGFLTTRLRINPFIVTLGTLGIIRGLALIISNGLAGASVAQELSRIWAKARCCMCPLYCLC